MNESGKDRLVLVFSADCLHLEAADGVQAYGLLCRCVCGGADVARAGKSCGALQRVLLHPGRLVSLGTLCHRLKSAGE